MQFHVFVCVCLCLSLGPLCVAKHTRTSRRTLIENYSDASFATGATAAAHYGKTGRVCVALWRLRRNIINTLLWVLTEWI